MATATTKTTKSTKTTETVETTSTTETTTSTEKSGSEETNWKRNKWLDPTTFRGAVVAAVVGAAIIALAVALV